MQLRTSTDGRDSAQGSGDSNREGAKFFRSRLRWVITRGWGCQECSISISVKRSEVSTNCFFFFNIKSYITLQSSPEQTVRALEKLIEYGRFVRLHCPSRASLLECGESTHLLLRMQLPTPKEAREVSAHGVAETLTARTPSVFDHGFVGTRYLALCAKTRLK